MSTTTAQPGLYPIPPREPPVRWLRWLLLLAVVVPSVLSALSIPVKVSPDRLLADLQAGEVQKVSQTCGESLEVGDGGVSFTIGSSVDLSNTLCWTDGTLHYRTNLAALRADLSAQTRGRVDLLGTVRATAATAGQPQPRVVQDLLPGWSSLMALLALVYAVAFVSTIVLLVTGPQPRFMTKWGVFWTLFMPLDAGLFWWLFYEAPWSARARSMPEPADYSVRRTFDGRARRAGGQMFLWLLLAGVVWSGLTAGVEGTLGSLLEPSGHTGTWAVQQASGHGPAGLGAAFCAYFPEDC